MEQRGVLYRYFDRLPVQDRENIVSLSEGDTPLIRARSLEDRLKADLAVYLKYEGANPSGSFKDRGMTVAVSKAFEDGDTAVVCASTGNTSASAAAYAARCGMKSLVVIPEGNIAYGKLSQALIHDAKVVQVKGNFDRALEMVLEIAKDYPVTLVNSLNPHRIEGQKTGSFEIVDSLGGFPDYHLLPVGNAGNITAYWRGFKEYCQPTRESKLPQMVGFQAAGASPIVDGRVCEQPETVATAIRIGNPANWEKAEKALDESGGRIGKISDESLLDAYRLLAQSCGVFCEPASAISVAGLFRLDREGYFSSGSVITCTLTGHGLKDPQVAVRESEEPPVVDPSLESLLEVVNL